MSNGRTERGEPQVVLQRSMSALGHKQTFALQKGMSALHPKADMCSATLHVRFVPIADIAHMHRCLRSGAKRRKHVAQRLTGNLQQSGKRPFHFQDKENRPRN